MANNSMGQGANMPTIGTINQGTIQYVNNPIQSPQLQATSIQGSPSQHSPMGTQSQVGAKANQSGAGDQTTQVCIHTHICAELLSTYPMVFFGGNETTSYVLK